MAAYIGNSCQTNEPTIEEEQIQSLNYEFISADNDKLLQNLLQKLNQTLPNVKKILSFR